MREQRTTQQLTAQNTTHQVRIAHILFHSFPLLLLRRSRKRPCVLWRSFFPASSLCSGTENDANKHSYFIESYDYDLLAHALRSNLVRELLSVSLASFRLHLAFVLIFCPKGQDIVVVVAFSNLWTKRLLLSLVYSTCGIPFLVLAKLWFCTALLYRA